MEKKEKGLKSFFQSAAAQKFFAFGSLIILVLFFSLANRYFFTPDNLVSILLSTCVNGVLAMGVTFIIITGGIDLSIGTVMTFSAVMGGVSVVSWGLPMWLGRCGCYCNRRGLRMHLRPFGFQA